MPATLDIRDRTDSLTIRVSKSGDISKFLYALVLGIVLGGHFLYSSGNPLLRFALVTFCLLVIVGALVEKIRGTEVELEINDRDLVSTGHASDGYKPSSIPRAVIYSFSFKQGLGGEDSSPTGLYVEHHGIFSNLETCMLPGIDETQTQQVIDAIMRRFPDTCAIERSGPAAQQEIYLTSLNLDRLNRVQ